MTVPETPSPDKSPDRIAPSKALEADQAIRQPPSGQGFQSYMEQGGPQKAAQPPTGPTPMEIPRSPAQMGTPTTETLMAQTKTVQDTLGTVQKQLQTPNLQIKRSQAHLLRNKLNDARDYGRAAAAKLGVETPPMKTPDKPGLIARFLAYLNDGQDQFAAVQDKLQAMTKSGEPINPADMMLVQSKLALAQQEIEYSSTILSKITSSITTIMSVQL